MVSVASQLIEEVTAHVQSDSLEDAREICADGTYFLKVVQGRNPIKSVRANFKVTFLVIHFLSNQQDIIH